MAFRFPEVARNPVSLVGVAITTAMAALFLVLLLLELGGFLSNPYAGLLVFVTVPVLFIIGLLLIPIGSWWSARRRRAHPDAEEWPVIDLRTPKTRRILVAVFALTIVNLVIVSLAAYGGVHYLESPTFCGQVCHTTMEPEAVAHTAWPHASVACTKCHVGPGARAFVEGKLAGTRQLFQVMTNRVPKPVPPPNDLIQPASVACEQCHSSEARNGERLRVIREFADDETNTETVTTFRLHVGDRFNGVHRHNSLDIEFVAADETKSSIPIVRVRDGKGGVREFVAEGDPPKGATFTRKMDCTDCHNRPAHTFSFTPTRAVDVAIARGSIPGDLAFVRREAVAAVSADYASRDAALEGIRRHLDTFYASRPGTDGALVKRAVEGAQGVWQRNVFPTMNVKWGTYPNHLGHVDTDGCFRCHDDSHKASDGSLIKQDCELCHTLPE